ncbi:hypothetical protein G4Y79_00645 [Phototrophicus methaneseepsis]|uniref:Uncharacterized protein n=1 Tax=Phototrophicus methaneseepsis TaxID=2710758 RepID=A0A7S8E9V5_9CHLR|nr:hypothetical protein [Phototrophicus methaneseepsis]QPC82913.1 hypothetical protein G4Y79_00645 [Phototrophicus methaneseepsis]
MPPANPAEKLLHAPLADLVELLIKQFKRLLTERGLTLTTAQISQIGQQAADKAPLPTKIDTLPGLIGEMVAESEAELQSRFQMGFAQSLATDMDVIGGWETTSEFLELANHKSNAELRISAGSTLLAFLGDTSRLHNLFSVIDADGGAMDVDAALARRALCHVAEVDPLSNDWLAQVKTRLGKTA